METVAEVDMPAHMPDGTIEAERLVGAMEALASRHGARERAFRPALLGVLKGAVQASRRHAEQQLMHDGRGSRCAKRLSDNQDEFIRALYDFATRHVYPANNPSSAERLAFVAVGGYGRGTLAPGSDIDLLFLLPYKQTAWSESVVEWVLYVLWDLGLKVGHATRRIDDTIRMARTDNTILTALIEARFVCGDRALFDELKTRFGKEVVGKDAKSFIAQKLAERDERHRQAGESRYLVEPDVKDGKGALRDLHTLFWIAKYVYGAQSPAELVSAGLFTRGELSRFLKCEDFLWAVRCHLHFMAPKGGDRLSFDKQAELAERLGYKAHGGLKHVERFMKHYFLIAKEVGDLTRIFCAVLEAREMKKAPALNRLLRGLTGGLPGRLGRAIKDYPQFRFDAGRINIVHDNVFAESPVNLIRLFGLACDLDAAIHPDALRQVRRSLKLIGPELCNDPEANRIFMSILCDSRDPEAVLRRMNEAGVLGRFIPDFGRIVALMQFNMYHHYTVDEHLLRAVGILADIEHGFLVDNHPLATDLIQTLANRRALYVAVLLHDIAKGSRERHSVAGERVAKALCPRFGLTPDETEMVAWLVRHHLLMSETAQMRDLNDFKTILDFSGVVQSPERLKLLLILTIADIRAVGPGVWNGWKGQLLRTLYFEAEPVLSGGHSSISRRDRVGAAQAAFRARMSDWSEDQLDGYIARHYDAYWLNSDIEHHVAHARLITAANLAGEQVATAIKTDQYTAITELTVLAPDHPRLLALLTGACAAAGANIASAQIFTTADGVALDTLLIQREFEDETDERRRAERIAKLIGKAVQGDIRIGEVVAEQTRPKRRLQPFTVEPRVIIDNESSNRLTVIEVNGLDRIGLLYDLTDA
ncbi:MAG TPA: [protein-PII] uridylyltransferase, partial [Aestuariivirgaceae bacterium]|nr:[protein-PII] uridylyltransferase [Aestuariivirgaceae bacterium]